MARAHIGRERRDHDDFGASADLTATNGCAARPVAGTSRPVHDDSPNRNTLADYHSATGTVTDHHLTTWSNADHHPVTGTVTDHHPVT